MTLTGHHHCWNSSEAKANTLRRQSPCKIDPRSSEWGRKGLTQRWCTHLPNSSGIWTRSEDSPESHFFFSENLHHKLKTIFLTLLGNRKGCIPCPPSRSDNKITHLVYKLSAAELKKLYRSPVSGVRGLASPLSHLVSELGLVPPPFEHPFPYL